jgi:hypothetical protein
MPMDQIASWGSQLWLVRISGFTLNVPRLRCHTVGYLQILEEDMFNPRQEDLDGFRVGPSVFIWYRRLGPAAVGYH